MADEESESFSSNSSTDSNNSHDEGSILSPDTIAIAAAAVVLISQQRKRKRSCWTEEWLKKRRRLGAYDCLLQELENEDCNAEKRFLRMSHDSFLKLLRLVGPRIQKKDTGMRLAKSPEDRLAITLRYLGSGSSFRELKDTFRISDSTVRSIVLETSKALYAQLKDKYLKVPSTPDEWRKISEEFEERWNFPHCIGAIGGKHIQITNPGPGEGSRHSRQEGPHTQSIALLGLVDASCKFLYTHVGTPGKTEETRVFRDSPLGEDLRDGTLGTPDPTPLPGRMEPVPFFVIGDDTFPLRRYLMRPFSQHGAGGPGDVGGARAEVSHYRRQQLVFDSKLFEARRTMENAFGVMASRFGVLQHPMRLTLENAASVLQACLALHNFLMEEKDNVYAPPSLLDRESGVGHFPIPGEWRDCPHTCMWDLVQQAGNRSSAEARWVRNEVKDYLNLADQKCRQAGSSQKSGRVSPLS